MRLLLALALLAPPAYADVVCSSVQTTCGGAGGGGSFGDNTAIIFGTDSDASLSYNTVQTPDALFCGVGQDSHSLIIAEKTDAGFDFAHPAQTHPTLFIHSANQSTTQWAGFSHDGTNAVFTMAGTGGFYFDGTSSDGRGNPYIIPVDAGDIGGYTKFMQGTSGQGTFLFTASGSTQAEVRIGYPGSSLYTNSSGLVLNSLASGAGTPETHYANVTTARRADSFSMGLELRVGSGTSGGTNTVGRDLILYSGTGTGNAVSGNIIVRTPVPTVSGTTVQSQSDRDLIIAAPTTLTESSATAFARVGIAQATAAGGVLHYCIRASDATNIQVRCGLAPWAAINEGGTESCTVGTVSDTTPTMTGTLTITFTCVSNAADTVDLMVNAVSSLTQTTLEIESRVMKNYGTGSVTRL